MKKILKLIPIILVVCPFLIWGASMLKCEILTWKYGKNFPCPTDISIMCGEPDYLKVLEYTDTYARVYYVNNTGGNTATFIRQDNEWKNGKWERTVWATFGSADSFEFPYIYHSSEGIGVLVIFGLGYIIICLIMYLSIRRIYRWYSRKQCNKRATHMQ